MTSDPPARSRFATITPLIPAGPSLAEGLALFTGPMGFTKLWEGRGMAGIRRDSIAFNLVENDNRVWADNSSFSIGVSDLDGLYAEYAGLPAKVGPLEVKGWGRREFHVILPSGVCLQFYQQP